jgi:hypothetical protein
MSDEYLWDRTGPPDPEIARLETVLAGYRYSAPSKRPRLRARALLAAAACVFLVASATLLLHRKPASEWRMSGKPVAVGQTIETSSAGAKLEAEFVGEVKLDPNSRLQVLAATAGNQRLALRRGTMHALIWAPPSRFVVDTPSAKTIDLGCSYTLSVLPDDSGILTVQSGWVALQAGPIESFIPAGAACRTRPRRGPGLPYFDDAPAVLRDAVTKFDATGDHEGLNIIISNARRRDALTLWHLVIRTSGADRDLVVQKLGDLIPGINSSGLRSGDSRAVDQAWNLLGLGATDWWRMWKRDWPQQYELKLR